jgi:hypothetical protein
MKKLIIFAAIVGIAIFAFSKFNKSDTDATY